MLWTGDPVTPDVLAAASTANPGHGLTADEFYKRLLPNLDSFGISRLADITGLDTIGFPVVQAVRARARSNIVTQGKAPSLPAAAVGAILECLEMAAGEDLSRLPSVDPDDTAIWRELAPGATWPSAYTDYVSAWSVTESRLTSVPRDLLSTDFARGAAAEAAPILRHSIGLGAGASMASALYHGLLECIEADARLRYFAGSHAHKIALVDSDPTYGPLLQRVSSLGMRVRATCISARPGPTVVAVSLMEPPSAQSLPLPASGFAARPSPSASIQAALAEAVQARLAAISGAREDMTQSVYRHRIPAAELEEEWRRHAPGPGIKPSEHLPTPQNVSQLAQGMGPVIAIPLVWRPEIPLAIVRVIAPDLIADPLRLEQAL